MPELAITPAAAVTAVARSAPQGHGATQAASAGDAARATDDAAAGTAGGAFARLLKSHLRDAGDITPDAPEPATDLASAATETDVTDATGVAGALTDTAPTDVTTDPALLVPGLAVAAAAVPPTVSPTVSPAVSPTVATAAVAQADEATTAGEALSLAVDKTDPRPAMRAAQPAQATATPGETTVTAASGATPTAKPSEAAATLAEPPRAAALQPAEAAPVKDAAATVEAALSRDLPPQARAAAVDASTLPPPPGLEVARTAIAAAPRPELPVPSPLGTRAWVEDVGQQVSWLAGQGQSKAELILTPPHLGRVEVSLSMNGDSTSAVFVSPSAAVRDALEQALPRLREAMAEAGIQLGQAHVSAESGTRRDGDAPARRDGGGNLAREDDLPVAPLRPTRGGLGMVDLFA